MVRRLCSDLSHICSSTGLDISIADPYWFTINLTEASDLIVGSFNSSTLSEKVRPPGGCQGLKGLNAMASQVRNRVLCITFLLIWKTKCAVGLNGCGHSLGSVVCLSVALLQ